MDYEKSFAGISSSCGAEGKRKRTQSVYLHGRSKAENIWEIGLDGMIGGNGSYVEDHGHVVMHQMITPSSAAILWTG